MNRILTRPGISRKDTVTFGNFSRNDDFEGPSLNKEWMTLRTSALDLYSLQSHPGWITLKEGSASVEETKTPSMICRRPQHHKFECGTKMRYVPGDEGDAAGLILFKDEQHSYFFAVGIQNGVQTLSVRKSSPAGIETLASIPYPESEVGLQIKSSGTSFSFVYESADAGSKLLLENVPAGFLSTAEAGGFTGTMLGLYAVDGKR